MQEVDSWKVIEAITWPVLIAIGAGLLLLLGARLQRLSEDARLAAGLRMSEPRKVTKARDPERLRRIAGWLRWAALAAAGAYLVFGLGRELLEYRKLRSDTGEARTIVGQARWNDPALACAADVRIGTQLGRMFDSPPEVFLARVLWDHVAPRYEFYVQGMARIVPEGEPRHVLLTLEVTGGGAARLQSAWISGEAGQEPVIAAVIQRSCKIG